MKKLTFFIIALFILLFTAKSIFATKIISKDTWKQGDREQLSFESNARILLVQARIKDENGNLLYQDLNMTKVSSDRWTTNVIIPSNIDIQKANAHITFYAGVNNYSISKEIDIEKMTTMDKITNFFRTHFNLKFVQSLMITVRKNLNIT